MEKRTILGGITAFFFAIFPFALSGNFFYSASATKYFLLIGGVSLLAIYFAYLVLKGKKKLSLKERWFLLSFVCSLFVLVLSSFVGEYTERSLFPDTLRSVGVFFILYAGLGAFLLSELLQKADWRLVRRAMIFAGTLFSILTYFGGEGGFGVGGQFGYIDLAQSGLTLTNSTFAGSYLLLIFIISVIECMISEERKQKITYCITSFLIILSPVLLHPFSFSLSSPSGILGAARASSATAILFALYVVGLSILRKIKQEKLIVVWNTILTLSVVVAVILLFIPGSIVQKAYIDESGSARIMVWNQSFEQITERPVLGWGPENTGLALEKNINTDLYLKENGGEIWFDRAHNIFVDTLLGVGYVGLFVFTITFLTLLHVLRHLVKRGDISFTEGNLWGALFIAHVIQLQTSFNVVVTYGILAFIVGYVLWLEKEYFSEEGTISQNTEKVIAGIFILLICIGSVPLFFKEASRKQALFDVFSERDTEQQLMLIDTALSRESDFEAIRLSSMSLIKAIMTKISGDPQSAGDIVNVGLEQLQKYENAYQEYISKRPDDYRIRMNYVYLLITESVLGDQKLDKATGILDASYELSPESPITDTLYSLVELYSGNVEGAKEKISHAVVLNPDVLFTQKVHEHILKQEETFPNITVIQLENL